jgi:putative SOS response-associated peptidase YedK
MCNLYRLEKGSEAIIRAFSGRQIPIVFPEGVPNFRPGEIRITDRAPIVRAAAAGSGAAELVQRRWSWPAPGGKPVYNYRSDGRDFGSGRCLILTDGFYEFTTHSDPKSKRKHKWLFTLEGAEIFCIAGIVRAVPEFGGAFTMLTTEPGPDVAPYHSRQVAVLPPERWAGWLDPAFPARELTGPLPAGSLRVEQVC